MQENRHCSSTYRTTNDPNEYYLCTTEAIREPLRTMTRMQLIRTLAAWRPGLSGYRDILTAYKIALKSLARRYLELQDEIADLDVMISVIVEELAPELIAGKAIGYKSAA